MPPSEEPSPPAPKDSSPSAPEIPSLKLSQGGGALRGIDEKSSVNPSTGTASLSLPLPITPGRSGFSPSLSLSYDSGAGNGPFGLGWTLGCPAISRKTDKGVPRYRNDDVFLISGTEDLVPALKADGTPDAFEKDGHQVRRYRPRIEGSFSRIERWKRISDGDVHWRALSPANVSSVFGLSPAARVADPADASRVFQWLLEEARDDRGNVCSYEYKPEDDVRVDRSRACEKNRLGGAFAQKYLKHVRYANQTPSQPGGWHFQLVFDYGEHDGAAPAPGDAAPWPARADPFSASRAGFEVRSYRLCRRVLMYHLFPELGADPCLARSLDFAYDERPVGTRLVSATQTGYVRQGKTYAPKSLPPMDMTYTERVLDGTIRLVDDPDALRELTGGVDGAVRQWTDFEGDGLAGVLSEQAGGWYYKRNLGGGRLAPAALAAPAPSGAKLAGGGQRLMDLTGEGVSDLVRFDDAAPGFYGRDGGGEWKPFRAFPSHPKIDWKDPNLRFVDVDGDGRPDVLIAQDEVFRWHASLGPDGFAPAEAAAKPRDEETGAALVFADGTETIFLADMSGDGLTDVVRVRNGEVCYWPSLGRGRFGPKVTMDAPPVFAEPEAFDPRRIRIGDTDGTGPADLVYLGVDGTDLYFNQSGGGWSARTRLPPLPAGEPLAAVTMTDLLGNGTSCLVWSSALPGTNGRPVRYFDLFGGTKPNLLASVANNLGKETRFTHAPSTKFYLEDRAAGRPWFTRLPFPVQVVEKVETLDLVAGAWLVTTYRYRHGFYDGVEREFRGFGYVEQRDAESFAEAQAAGSTVPAEFHRPPVVSKSWLHTGAYVEEDTLSRLYKDEYYQGDAAAVPLPDTSFDRSAGPWTVQEERESCRALKGRVLRREVYALDGTALEPHPYSVAESRHEVRRLQPMGDRPHAVFLAYERETLTSHYERDPADPRIDHQISLEVDAYGNAVRSLSVSYARRVPAEPEQDKTRITYKELDVTHKDAEADWYRLSLPVETRNHEITGLSPKGAVFALEEALSAGLEGLPTLPFEAVPGTGPAKRLVDRSRTLYLKDDLSGPLSLGDVESLALPYKTYVMAFTPNAVSRVYAGRRSAAALQALLQDQARYLSWDGAWWIPSGRSIFDPTRFYLAVGFTDPFTEPLNLSTKIGYDVHALLPETSEDPLGNLTKARNNYRTLSPWLVTDPNGNRSAVRLDALGMLTASARMGKPGAGEGDSLDLSVNEASAADDPTGRMEYDLDDWRLRGKPVFVRSLARETHGDPASRWQESYTYADGFGREIMRKTMAEPGSAPLRGADGSLQRDGQGRPVYGDVAARWVGSGRTIFDNKGEPVKKYEPFFDSSPAFTDEADLVEMGASSLLRYDPLGRLIRTDAPDGTFSKTVFSPWGREDWDANDTVLDSDWYAGRGTPDPAGAEPSDPQARAAWLSAAHAETPVVSHLDALGHSFLSVADNGVDAAGTRQLLPTRSTMDVKGNVLALSDARGVLAAEGEYDMASRKLRQKTADGGERWTLYDAGGRVMIAWDAPAGSADTNECVYAYDELGRPRTLTVAAGAAAPALAEETVYGEGQTNPEGGNLRGRAFRKKDGAGVLLMDLYDFKGNLLRTTRTLFQDPAAAPDWTALAAESFVQSTTYDALDRPTSTTNQADGSVVLSAYNEAGLLESVSVRVRGAAATPFIKDLDYDAKGRRVSISRGKGTTTACAYDPLNEQLLRVQTTRAGRPGPLQDLNYVYDAVGNVVHVRDDAQQTVYFSNAAADPHSWYRYDPLYRLVYAKGREHAGTAAPAQPSYDWDDGFRTALPHVNDGQALRMYEETYAYDDAGNIASVGHAAPNNGNWNRRYACAADSNRLLSTSLSGDPATGPLPTRYGHDGRGNMTAMIHLPSLEWDFKNQLRSVNLQGGGTALYAYDSTGQRVRKVVDRGAGLLQERVYLGFFEVYRERTTAGVQSERQTLHVMDDRRRSAMVDTLTRDKGRDVAAPVSLVRHRMDNHLGSACVEVDENDDVVSYEEYYPFGGTSYQGARSAIEAGLKRYRYVDKERDDETGLYYYGARYYAPWLGRWTSCDPSFSPNLYVYGNNNPIRFNDPDGRDPACKGQPGCELTWSQRIIATRRTFQMGATDLDAATELQHWKDERMQENFDAAQAKAAAEPQAGPSRWERFKEWAGEKYERASDWASSTRPGKAYKEGTEEVKDSFHAIGSDALTRVNPGQVSNGVPLYDQAASDSQQRAAAMGGSIGEGVAETGIAIVENAALDEAGGLLLKGAGTMSKAVKTEGGAVVKSLEAEAKTLKVVETTATGEKIVKEVPIKKLPPGPMPKEGPTVFPTGKTPQTPHNASALEGEGRRVTKAYARDPLHHLLPQEHRKWFAGGGRNLNVDNFAVDLTEGDHSALHTMKWNKKWETYIKANPNATAKDVLKQMEKMRKEFKIDKLPIVPYDR